jgi:hypothetical protein
MALFAAHRASCDQALVQPASNLSPSLRGRSFHACRLAPIAGQKGCHQLEWVCAKGTGDADEFHDIEPALAALVFGDQGLSLFQTNGVKPAALRAPTISAQTRPNRENGRICRYDGCQMSSAG